MNNNDGQKNRGDANVFNFQPGRGGDAGSGIPNQGLNPTVRIEPNSALDSLASTLSSPIPGAPPSSPDTSDNNPSQEPVNHDFSSFSRSSSGATVIDPFATPTPRHSYSDLSNSRKARSPSPDLSIPLSSSTPIRGYAAPQLRPSPLKPAPPISLKRLETVEPTSGLPVQGPIQPPKGALGTNESPDPKDAPRQPFFGVRSYLDDFYDSQGRRNSHKAATRSLNGGNGLDADESSRLFAKGASNKPDKRHKRSRHKKGRTSDATASSHDGWGSRFCQCLINPMGWKMCLVGGFIVLALGLALIMYGFLTKQKAILIRPEQLDDTTGTILPGLETNLQAYVDDKVSVATREEIDKALAKKPSLVSILDRENQEDTLSQSYVRDALRKNLLILDKSALRHNRRLNWFKMTGLLLFFSAALLLTLALLMSAVCLTSTKVRHKRRSKGEKKSYTLGRFASNRSYYGDEGGLVDCIDDNTSSEYDSISSGAESSQSSEITLLSSGSAFRLTAAAPPVQKAKGLVESRGDEAYHFSNNDWLGAPEKEKP